MTPVCGFGIVARHLERLRKCLTQDIRDGGSLMAGKIFLPLLQKERSAAGVTINLRQRIGLGIEYSRSGCRNLRDIRFVDCTSSQFRRQSCGITGDGLARRNNLLLGLMQARLCVRPSSFCLGTPITSLIASSFELVSFSGEPGIYVADRFAAEYSSSLLGPLVRFGLSCLMGLAGCFKTFLLRPRGNQLV